MSRRIFLKGLEEMTPNQDIKMKAKRNNVKLWEVADKLGIADTTMSRWLRKELPTDKKQSMLDIIDQIAAEKRIKEKK